MHRYCRKAKQSVIFHEEMSLAFAGQEDPSLCKTGWS